MNDEPHDLVGAYAMDALDPEERLAFEGHLRSCASCRDELAGLSDALAELSADYEVAPPPALRAAVLNAVADLDAPSAAQPAESTAGAAGTAGEPPLPRRAVHEPEAGDAAEPAKEPAAAPVTPLRPPSTTARPRWQLLLAAALALIAVIGISVWQPWVQRTITAADVLAAPDAVRATKTMDGGASVTLVRSDRLGRAVLVTHSLPPAPTGKAHQAWLQHRSGAMTSGGMMPSGADVTMLLEGDARDTVGAGISIEPPGGSVQPTLDDVVVLIGL